jgi:hypothetical protein
LGSWRRVGAAGGVIGDLADLRGDRGVGEQFVRVKVEEDAVYALKGGIHPTVRPGEFAIEKRDF